MNPRKLSKVILVVELDDGTRDTISRSSTLRPKSIDGRSKEDFALLVGEQLKQDFIRYMYDVVWAE